jgi:hypothetical protein
LKMLRRSRNSTFISARVSLYLSGMGTGGADATHSFLLAARCEERIPLL